MAMVQTAVYNSELLLFHRGSPQFGVRVSSPGGFPTLRKLLPMSAILILLAHALPAQDHFPASTHARRATVAHLENLAFSDFTGLVSQAQSGYRNAQY